MQPRKCTCMHNTVFVCVCVSVCVTVQQCVSNRVGLCVRVVLHVNGDINMYESDIHYSDCMSVLSLLESDTMSLSSTEKHTVESPETESSLNQELFCSVVAAQFIINWTREF